MTLATVQLYYRNNYKINDNSVTTKREIIVVVLLYSDGSIGTLLIELYVLVKSTVLIAVSESSNSNV